jgi:hypothetical protein
MNRREFSKLVGAAAITPVLGPGRGVSPLHERWSFTAHIAECCSCDIPCSCNFGRPEQTCHGTRLIQIREGQFEGDQLAGINFVVTFYMRRWTRIYVDDSLTEAKIATLDRLLPVAFAGFAQLAQVQERVPLTVSESPDTFRFTVPESTVEMKLFPGLDGSAITISGLPSRSYHDYVQYESVVHTHRSAEAEWSYAGTNGFQSEMRVAG